MPKQVIRPAASLAQCVDIASTEEIGLRDQMLQVELSGLDSAANVLMTWVISPRVPTHGYQPLTPGFLYNFARFVQPVCQRNFNLYMLAGFQTSQGLSRMHGSGRTQNDRVQAWQGQSLNKVTAMVRRSKTHGDITRPVDF